MFPQHGISGLVSQGAAPSVPRLAGHYLAQVIGVLAKEHAVNILLPALSKLEASSDTGGVKCQVLARRAGGYIGEVDLPRVGDWGVVVFLQGSHQYPVWMGSLYPAFAGLATGVPGEQIEHHDSGVYSRIDPDGNVEVSHPSGTYLRIGEGTALAPRTRRRRKANAAEAEHVPYAIPAKPIPTVHLNHPAGTTVTINPDGGVVLVTPAATVTITAAGNVSIEAQGTVGVEAGGAMTLQSAVSALMYGVASTQIGSPIAMDTVALKAALDLILSTFNGHTHNGGQVPDQQLGAWVAGTHHTINTRAL